MIKHGDDVGFPILYTCCLDFVAIFSGTLQILAGLHPADSAKAARTWSSFQMAFAGAGSPIGTIGSRHGLGSMLFTDVHPNLTYFGCFGSNQWFLIWSNDYVLAQPMVSWHILTLRTLWTLHVPKPKSLVPRLILVPMSLCGELWGALNPPFSVPTFVGCRMFITTP